MKFNKHLIYISPGFAEGIQDTTCIPAFQIFFQALIKEIPAENIHIITLHYPFVRKIYKWNGINVYSCGGKNSRGFNKLQAWSTAKKYFKQICRENPVEIIHSFWFSECCYIGQKMAAESGISHVCTILGQEAISKTRYTKRIDLSKLTLTAPSEFTGRNFKKIRPEAIITILPLGIDTTEFENIQPQKRDIDILGVGSLVPVKSFHLFVEVIDMLVSQKRNIRAVILGDGTERDRLEVLTKEKGLENIVKFEGLVSRGQVLDYMQRSKILLHPSQCESFGMVYAEALHSGMSVISRANGCYSPSDRWLIAEDTSSFAVQTAWLLDNFSEKEPSLVFDIRKTIQKHLDLYEGLIKS